MKSLGLFLVAVVIAVLLVSGNASAFRNLESQEFDSFLDGLIKDSSMISLLAYKKGLEEKSCDGVMVIVRDLKARMGEDELKVKAFQLVESFTLDCCMMGRNDRATKTLDYLAENLFVPALQKRTASFITAYLLLAQEE